MKLANRKRRPVAWFAAAILALLVSSAQAVPMRFTLTGIASGSLGGTPFNSAAFTVLLDGDTDAVTVWSGDGQSTYSFFGPGFAPPGSVASIQVAGLPLANFTQAVEIFLAQGYTSTFGHPFLSFGRPNSNTSLPGWAGMIADGLSGVSLASEFSSNDAGPTLCSVGPRIFTDQGNLVADSCSSRLTSVTAEFTQVVPLPGAVWLFAGALGMLAAVRRTGALA